jgi:pilus assembly protein CpaE
MRRAMRAGICDLVAHPLDRQELETALGRARDVQHERRDAQLLLGRTVAFFGAGGGLGTTTLAVNTGVLIARRSESRVLLADFDLEGGDLPIFLDLDDPATTFTDLLADTPGGASLPGQIATHRSGLHALPGPRGIEELEAVTRDDVTRAVGLCRSAFATTVIDAGHALTDASIAVLDHSDHIYLVTQLTLPNLQSAARRLDLLGRLGYPEERCSIVLNRKDKRAQIDRAAAEQMLGRPIEFEIGSDYRAALAAIEAGVPLVEERRGRRLQRMIEAIAERHLGDTT